jgi:anthranilate synthase/aminodeoxychorismate synthase-like glutamine amidotransferase
VTTLVVDNYDSFTWNLVQLIGALGERPVVVRNDELTLDDVRALAPSRVLLSPGPGHPGDPARIGVSEAILRELAPAGLPVLGVCLGHQAIVHVYGGLIVRGAPVHGKTSPVEHDGDAMFEGVPRIFQAMRYHSLVADPPSLPSTLRVTAWCKDGTVMAVRHTRFPVVGVQFHPESIGTPDGPRIVETFVRHGVRG